MPCHKRDWKQYNKQLINRGNLNFWVTKKALKSWKAKKRKKVGRPFTYSDEAIKAMLIVRFKYQLPVLSKAHEHPQNPIIHTSLSQDAKHPAARRANK